MVGVIVIRAVAPGNKDYIILPVAVPPLFGVWVIQTAMIVLQICGVKVLVLQIITNPAENIPIVIWRVTTISNNVNILLSEPVILILAG
jgi:hypothetical protein